MIVLYIKVLHIIFVISWFAGLFYLPRIFVNIALVEKEHLERNPTSINLEIINLRERSRLVLMAKKLFRFTTPIMFLALFFGLWLWLGFGIGLDDKSFWMHAKILLVFFLLFYHFYCGSILRKLIEKPSIWSHVKFRWFNELPVILMFLSVFLVVTKPF